MQRKNMKNFKWLFCWFFVLVSFGMAYGGMPSFFHGTSQSERISAHSKVRSMRIMKAEKLADIRYTVAPDDEWTALFYNNSGVAGPAGFDGMNSIPLSGSDAYNPQGKGATVFTVGDTLVGSIDPVTGLRSKDTYMIHNGFVMLKGNHPVPANLSYCYGDNNGKLATLMIPEPEWVGNVESLYWPFDGIAFIKAMNVFADELNWDHDTGGLTNESVWNMSVLKSLPFGKITQTRVPLFFPGTADRSLITYGSCVFPNTVSGGSPSPDGYIYIFGCREDKDGSFPNYKVISARVPQRKYGNIAHWRYWDGKKWGKDPVAAAPLADHASNELNVGWIRRPDGTPKIVLTYMKDVFSGWLTARVASTDPKKGFRFSDPVFFYQTPEPASDPTGNVFTYGAKAHPHLSPRGEILVSYNVNSFDNAQNWTYGNIYHPRFVRVTLKRSL